MRWRRFANTFANAEHSWLVKAAVWDWCLCLLPDFDKVHTANSSAAQVEGPNLRIPGLAEMEAVLISRVFWGEQTDNKSSVHMTACIHAAYGLIPLKKLAQLTPSHVACAHHTESCCHAAYLEMLSELTNWQLQTQKQWSRIYLRTWMVVLLTWVRLAGVRYLFVNGPFGSFVYVSSKLICTRVIQPIISGWLWGFCASNVRSWRTSPSQFRSQRFSRHAGWITMTSCRPEFPKTNLLRWTTGQGTDFAEQSSYGLLLTCVNSFQDMWDGDGIWCDRTCDSRCEAAFNLSHPNSPRLKFHRRDQCLPNYFHRRAWHLDVVWLFLHVATAARIRWMQLLPNMCRFCRHLLYCTYFSKLYQVKRSF